PERGRLETERSINQGSIYNDISLLLTSLSPLLSAACVAEASALSLVLVQLVPSTQFVCTSHPK
uniref:Uncharacterized protein n=1 Tax=Strigamia maritima TaxID=126957 RepID=T1JKZ5_STRMM